MNQTNCSNAIQRVRLPKGFDKMPYGGFKLLQKMGMQLDKVTVLEWKYYMDGSAVFWWRMK